MRIGLVAAALAAALLVGCSENGAGGGGSGGGGSGGGPGGSGGGGAGGAGGSETGLAPPGKVQMTVDGELLVADGTFNLFGASSGVGAHFPNGANTSVGFTGAAAGTYESASGAVDWIYNALDGQYRCKSDIAGSSCSVTVTLYGPDRGDHETGTFQGTLVRQSGTGPETVTITAGSYDLTGN